jgi:hypothetical protein
MKWPEFLKHVSDIPVFSSRLILEGPGKLDVRRQLARWTAAGKLISLAKGVYILAPLYRKVDPHPFVVANALKKDSYVSLLSAMAHHGMFTRRVDAVTSITTGYPGSVQNEFGTFIYRHIKQDLFSDFSSVEVAAGQQACVATPEKCLLDYVYLTPDANPLRLPLELGLQNLDIVSRQKLGEKADTLEKPMLKRTARRLQWMIRAQVDRHRRLHERLLRIRRERGE